MAGEAAPAEAAAAAAPQAVAQMEAAAAATVEAGEAAPAGAAGEGSLELFVQGALPHEHAGALKELLRRHGVAFARVDKPQRRTFFYVSFRSRDDLVRGDAALRAIPGRSLRTKPARGKRPREASVDAQRPPKRAAPPASAEGEGEGGAGEAEGGEAEAKGGDAAEADGDDPSGDAAPRGDKPPRTLADATTPLWRLSYEEQLKKKQRAAENILRRIGRTVRSQFAPEAEMVTGYGRARGVSLSPSLSHRVPAARLPSYPWPTPARAAPQAWCAHSSASCRRLRCVATATRASSRSDSTRSGGRRWASCWGALPKGSAPWKRPMSCCR